MNASETIVTKTMLSKVCASLFHWVSLRSFDIDIICCYRGQIMWNSVISLFIQLNFSSKKQQNIGLKKASNGKTHMLTAQNKNNQRHLFFSAGCQSEAFVKQ